MNRATSIFSTLILFLGFAHGVSAQRRSTPPPGLRSKVTFKVSEGSLLEATRQIEEQTGVLFSVLPELFPEDVRVPDLESKGTLKAGLDLLAKKAGLKWQIGVFGGIVLLPPKPSVPDPRDWMYDNFDVVGLEMLKVGEGGKRNGLADGDVLVAVNGEQGTTWEELRAIRYNSPQAQYKISVSRGKETFHVSISKRSGPGFSHSETAPSVWDRYQKGGHQDPKWDSHFKKMDDILEKSRAC